MADKNKKKSTTLGCIFWIAFILLVLMLFFFNRKNIETVLAKTKVLDILFGRQTQEEVASSDQQNNDPIIDLITKDDGAQDSIIIQPEESPVSTAKPTATPKSTATTNEKTATPKASTPTSKPTSTPKPTTAPAVSGRTASIYFVSIDSDGRVLRKEVKRTIAQTDSPLSETLITLFKGTSPAEEKAGMRTLIPDGTRLLSASVRDGIATLNLSEEFQFNQFGIEGYLAQLAQVVYTATTFSTVQSVQFIIEGKKRDYLGAEGVWIGSPLGRDKF